MPTTHTVKHENGVTYIFGEINVRALLRIINGMPEVCVADAQLAKAANASFAIGTPQDCDSQLQRLTK